MRKLIFILSIVISLSFEITSCQIKKEVINSSRNDNKKTELVELNFEILTDKISFDEINKIDDFKQKLRTYLNLEILATLKQISITVEKIELDNFIIYENFEITNLKKEPKDDLIIYYDYTPVFDPETYEDMIDPKKYSIDTINLVNDFRFYKSAPDTLLIRIKKQYFEKYFYSNWDTLMIK